MTTLKNQIQSLADKFATEVLAAIRGASLHEILEGGGGGAGAARPARGATIIFTNF